MKKQWEAALAELELEQKNTALLVADGFPCNDILSRLLQEHCHFTVFLDKAYHRYKNTLKGDVWLGDFDDFKPQKEASLDLIIDKGQDNTDFEKGLDFLVKKGFKNVIAIGATGRRSDHYLNNLFDLVKYRHQLHIYLFDDFGLSFLLPKRFVSKYPIGQRLSLMPLPEAKGIISKGLKYPLLGNDLCVGGKTGSSNTVDESPVSIVHSDGHLLLVVSWQD